MRTMTRAKHVRRLGGVAAVGITALAWASPAQADMTLTLTDVNTGATAVVDDFGTGDAFYGPPPQTLGNYRINSISASANYDGNTDGNINTGDANILNTVLRVTQTGTTGGSSDSLIITVTTSGTSSWSIPSGGLLILSSTNAVSRIDGSNGTATGSFSTFASTLTSGITSTTVTAPNAYGAVTTTNSGLASNPTPPFYLSNILTINTTGLNEVVNLSASTDVVAVPEPSTGIVALAGGLLMWAFGRRRRRGVE